MTKLQTIYVVFKTHFDIGFTGLAEEIIEFYRKGMLNDVIETCKNTQQYPPEHRYVWTMSSWPLSQSLIGDDTRNIDAAEELINQGQLRWHMLPFTTHTEFCGLEEYIRGLYISKRLSNKYDVHPITAKMTDVPGHTWMLPSILHKAGVRFLHLGCNACSTPPDVPRLFYWEGPDGNRILTYYSKGGYGTNIMPPEDWDYPVWLALLQTHDNSGPQSHEFVKEILDEVEERSPGTKVVIGTLDDFVKDLLKIDLDIPVIKKDLADSWIHGIGTYPVEVAKIRDLRQEVFTLESMFTFEQLKGKLPQEIKEVYNHHIRSAYEQILLFGEHTWGLDTKITLLPYRNGERVYYKKDFLIDKKSDCYKRAEQSWKEQSSYVDKAQQEIKSIYDYRQSYYKNGNDNNLIHVFNPLGWKRKATITFDSKLYENCQLIDLETEKQVVCWKEDGTYKAELCNLPALGYKTFIVQHGEMVNKDSQCVENKDHQVTLQNKWISVVIDANKGYISSLYDKATQKEWIDEEEELGFGQYVYDIYGKEDIIQFLKEYAYDLTDWYVKDFGKPGYPWIKSNTFVPMKYHMEIKKGFGWEKVILIGKMKEESYSQYGNAKLIKIEISLAQDSKFIDITYHLLDKQETPFAESGHFIFPINAKQPRYAVHKMGSVIYPQEDIQSKANTILYCCDKWVDIEDEGKGIAIIPIDTPLVSIGKKGIYKYCENYKPKNTTMYFNAFNNQWGTNFPQWMGGNYCFSYRIYPHQGDWKKGKVWKIAEETVVPVKVQQRAEENNDKIEQSIDALFSEDLDGIIVKAFKSAEDNKGYVLRLQDSLGETRKTKIIFKDKLKSAYICNHLEEIKEPLTILDNDKKIEIITQAFEIHTIKLVFKT